MSKSHRDNVKARANRGDKAYAKRNKRKKKRANINKSKSWMPE